MQSVRDEVMSNNPGDAVDVVVLRDGEEVAVSGNYGRWPETIAYQPIDENADQRYRSIQDRRLARRIARAGPNGIRRSHSQLAPAGALSDGLGRMAERAVAREENNALTPEQAGDRMVVAGIAMARRMPAWQFSYFVGVERWNGLPPTAATAVQPTNESLGADATADDSGDAEQESQWLVELGASDAAPVIQLNYRTRVAAGAL